MHCYHMITLKNGTIVPCGKCPACLANLRQEWVFRLKQEYLASEFALFVTFTYDNEHVPEGMNVNKKDVQNFHKRLRKHFPSGDLRYYVVSEYGDHTFRPHYHGLYFFKSRFSLDFIYSSFETSWNLGFIKFGEVEEGSIVYCTKYCLKHSSIPDGRAKTFRLVSKMNGGLGINYLTDMNDYHVQNMQFNFVYHNGKKCRMPRYYRTKLQFDSNTSAESLRIFKEQQIEDIISSEYKEASLRFAEFCKQHKGLSYSDMCKQFNELSQHSHDQRDRLILLHTKKQKF